MGVHLLHFVLDRLAEERADPQRIWTDQRRGEREYQLRLGLIRSAILHEDAIEREACGRHHSSRIVMPVLALLASARTEHQDYNGAEWDYQPRPLIAGDGAHFGDWGALGE